MLSDWSGLGSLWFGQPPAKARAGKNTESSIQIFYPPNRSDPPSLKLFDNIHCHYSNYYTDYTNTNINVNISQHLPNQKSINNLIYHIIRSYHHIISYHIVSIYNQSFKFQTIVDLDIDQLRYLRSAALPCTKNKRFFYDRNYIKIKYHISIK